MTLRLRDNYRSTPEILAAASWTIAGQDPDFVGRLPFHPQCPSGPVVEVSCLLCTLLLTTGSMFFTLSKQSVSKLLQTCRKSPMSVDASESCSDILEES